MVSEFSPTGNWIAHPETEQIPLISFGTSSDRIFTPEGNQAYYVTVAKSIPGTPLSPYVSLNYSEFEGGFNLPFGVNTELTREWDCLYMNDGRRSHVLITYKMPAMNITLMAIDLKRPRFGVSVGFGF